MSVSKRNSKILLNKYTRKKPNSPPPRSATIPIPIYDKFSNNFKFHALGHEIVLGECEGKIFLNLECAAHSKSFNSIDLDFPFPNALTVNLVERPMMITPVDKFVEYILKIGEKGCIAWANLIQNYQESYSAAYAKCRKDLQKNTPESNKYIIRTASAWEELIRNRNAMWVTTIYNANGKNMKSFTISNKLLETLGYDRDSFCSKVVREGFPRMFLTDKTYFEVSPLNFEEYHLLNYRTGPIVKKSQLYNSQDRLLNAIQSFQIYVIQTGNEEEIEARALYMYDVDEDSLTEPAPEMLNSKYTEALLLLHQQKCAFLAEFYDKYGGDVKNSIRCRVRELKDESQMTDSMDN